MIDVSNCSVQFSFSSFVSQLILSASHQWYTIINCAIHFCRNIICIALAISMITINKQRHVIANCNIHMNWSAIQVQDILQVVRLDILYSCRLYHEATTTWKVHLILNFWILFFCFWKNMLWWYYNHQKYVDSEKR